MKTQKKDKLVTSRDYTEEYYKPHIISYKAKDTWAKNRLRLLNLIGILKSDNVLDLGTGMGTFSFEVKRKGANVIGVDYSATALELAKNLSREQLLDIPYICADCTELPFTGGRFDKVLMMNLIEHLYRLQFKKTVREVDRILKPGGKIIINTDNPWATSKSIWKKTIALVFWIINFTLEISFKAFKKMFTIRTDKPETSKEPFMSAVPKEILEQVKEKYEKLHVDVKSIITTYLLFFLKGYRIDKIYLPGFGSRFFPYRYIFRANFYTIVLTKPK